MSLYVRDLGPALDMFRIDILSLGWQKGAENNYICKHIVTGEEVQINMGYVQRKLLKTLTGEWAKF